MKAIIPVAGIGSKLRPHTHTQPKAMMPVAGKPILVHIMDTLIAGGVKDFVLVIGYLGNKIESFISSAYAEQKLGITFIIQEPREGIGHAIWSAREQFRSESEILIMLGDTILNLEIDQFIKSEHTIIGTKKVDTPGNFGVAEIDDRGSINKLIEKPKIPKSNHALVGIYKITNPQLLVEAVEHMVDNKIITLGEYQLTDALMYMLEKGEKMIAYPVDKWYDCGKKDSLLEANAILLASPEFTKTKQFDFKNTIVIPPVSIADNCEISDSIIGPNVAIAENTSVTNAIVQNTIVGSFSKIDMVVLKNSVIGSDTSLRGLSQSLNIGDNTEIDFSK
ncbi:MAG: sugar phosphate nucleotidyltransferase [Cyclobacteriaceae bacterium]